ncbi:MAG: hypothetical protein ACREQY_03985, partial [Candidatus Binatia bacterium]
VRGQTNFLTMLWKFHRVYNPERQCADHSRAVTYSMRPPRPRPAVKPSRSELYVHAAAPARAS